MPPAAGDRRGRDPAFTGLRPARRRLDGDASAAVAPSPPRHPRPQRWDDPAGVRCRRRGGLLRGADARRERRGVHLLRRAGARDPRVLPSLRPWHATAALPSLPCSAFLGAAGVAQAGQIGPGRPSSPGPPSTAPRCPRPTREGRRASSSASSPHGLDQGMAAVRACGRRGTPRGVDRLSVLQQGTLTPPPRAAVVRAGESCGRAPNR